MGRAEVGSGLKRQMRRALHAAGFELSRYGRRVNPDEPELWERTVRDEQHLIAAMAACVRQDANCVDVGSYRGHVIEHMARLAPDGRHIAFEPIPWCATALEGRWANVEVRSAVVDAKSRTIELGDGDERVTVAVVSLDDALAGHRVDFLRIDVEDTELRVLQGAVQTIRRCRPILVFEHSREYDAEGEALGAREAARNQGLFELLVDELHYRIFDLDGAGPFDRDEFRAGYTSMRRFNFLAVPEKVEPRADDEGASIRSVA